MAKKKVVKVVGASRRYNYCNPCRICGNTNITEILTPSGSFMTCENCNISSDIGKTAKIASDYWNAIMKKEEENNGREV